FRRLQVRRGGFRCPHDHIFQFLEAFSHTCSLTWRRPTPCFSRAFRRRTVRPRSQITASDRFEAVVALKTLLLPEIHATSAPEQTLPRRPGSLLPQPYAILWSTGWRRITITRGLRQSNSAQSW